MNNFKLRRNEAGRLVLLGETGEAIEGVVPVRAFPISSPAGNISLLDEAGHELRWIAQLADVPEAARSLIEAELAQREFMPEISRIKQVSSFSTPSRWQVATNRGDAELLLKAEDHIRRLSLTMLLITDGYGVSYLIRNVDAMDGHSRQLLDRFL
jgi:hypothetical protein